MSVFAVASETALDAATFFARRGEFEHCELVDGRVVRMSPTGLRHGLIELRVARLLDDYVRRSGSGLVVVGEVGYQLSHDRVRAADVALHLELPDQDESGWVTTPPDLIVEILSPSDRWADVERKMDEYLDAGVREVWVCDPATKRVHVRRPGGNIELFRVEATLSTPLLPGLEIELQGIFAAP